MIIVTGGSGFIGSNMIRYLNQKGFSDILIVDGYPEKSVDKWKTLEGLDFSDFCNYTHGIDHIREVIKRKTVEVVFHIGAQSDVSVRDVDQMLAMNAEHSRFWYSYCKAMNIPFIYASSSAVYGNSRECSSGSINERPLNAYGFSKLVFDKFILHHLMKDLPPNMVIGFRLFNVFGHGEQYKGKNASIPFRFFEFIDSQQYIELFDADIHRDYVWVEDVVTIMYRVWAEGCSSGIYNLGGGNPLSHEEVARIVVEEYLAAGALKGSFDKYIKHIPVPTEFKDKLQFFTHSRDQESWISEITDGNKKKLKVYITELIKSKDGHPI